MHGGKESILGDDANVGELYQIFQFGRVWRTPNLLCRGWAGRAARDRLDTVRRRDPVAGSRSVTPNPVVGSGVNSRRVKARTAAVLRGPSTELGLNAL